MGKDLKGKELGKGLGQRKDKSYYAKYSYHGKKGWKKCDTLAEAKTGGKSNFISVCIQNFDPQCLLI